MRVESHENLICEIIHFSDCCEAEMVGSQIDHELCPSCGEHCEVVKEEWILEKN